MSEYFPGRFYISYCLATSGGNTAEIYRHISIILGPFLPTASRTLGTRGVAARVTWPTYNMAGRTQFGRVNNISTVTVKQWGNRLGNVYSRFRNYHRTVSKRTPSPPRHSGGPKRRHGHTYSSSSSSIAQRLLQTSNIYTGPRTGLYCTAPHCFYSNIKLFQQSVLVMRGLTVFIISVMISRSQALTARV